MEAEKVQPVDQVHPALEEEDKSSATRGDSSDGDSINSAALGDDLPPGYFYSPRFLGAMTV